MNFNNDKEKILAEKYITYNTSWSMLKRSQNLLKFNKKQDGYKNITFEDIKVVGMTNYYYSQMLKPLVENFEHDLKVYMSHQITKLSGKDREDYEKQLFNYVDSHYNHAIRKISKNKNILFNLHDVLTLGELIDINNFMTIYDENILLIDRKVKNLRNDLYHHTNVLTFYAKNRDEGLVSSEIIPILNYFNVKLSKKQLKLLSCDYHYNNLVQILKMLYYSDYFLSQDICCKKRKDYMYTHLNQNLVKTINKYNIIDKSKKVDWVETNLSVLDIVFKSATTK